MSNFKIFEIFEFFFNQKKVLTNGLLQRIKLLASHQSVPYHHGTKMTQNLIKSKKNIFGSPRLVKKYNISPPKSLPPKHHFYFSS